MSNLYFHYPFCKQACHYCNFHFSTSLKNKDSLWETMKKELKQRSDELNSPIESIYFGGGSPSLLNSGAIENTIGLIHSLVEVTSNVEVTLEVNPDDVSSKYLKALKAAGVNRLSLGVQSFLDRDLVLMNRVHNSKDALEALESVSTHFNNYSLDLIYGMPYSTLTEWEQNLNTAMAFDPPHLSSYALTVEPKTALYHQVQKGEILLIPEEAVQEQNEGSKTDLDRDFFEDAPDLDRDFLEEEEEITRLDIDLLSFDFLVDLLAIVETASKKKMKPQMTN